MTENDIWWQKMKSDDRKWRLMAENYFWWQKMTPDGRIWDLMVENYNWRQKKDIWWLKMPFDDRKCYLMTENDIWWQIIRSDDRTSRLIIFTKYTADAFRNFSCYAHHVGGGLRSLTLSQADFGKHPNQIWSMKQGWSSSWNMFAHHGKVFGTLFIAKLS